MSNHCRHFDSPIALRQDEHGDWLVDCPAHIYDPALKFCNDLRAEKNEEPLAELPPGVGEDPRSCPCGKATGWEFLYGHARRWDDYVPDPRSMVHSLEFPAWFDAVVSHAWRKQVIELRTAVKPVRVEVTT